MSKLALPGMTLSRQAGHAILGSWLGLLRFELAWKSPSARLD